MINDVDTNSYPMAECFSLITTEIGAGKAVISVRPQEKFFNSMQRMHGGFAATVIDSALGHAIGTCVLRGAGFGTIDLKITYVRRIDMTSGLLECTANVLHSGRTVLTAEARLVDESGALCAHGTGTFMVYPK